MTCGCVRWIVMLLGWVLAVGHVAAWRMAIRRPKEYRSKGRCGNTLPQRMLPLTVLLTHGVMQKCLGVNYLFTIRPCIAVLIAC